MLIDSGRTAIIAFPGTTRRVPAVLLAWACASDMLQTAVCQTAIAECNRWLNRFKQAEACLCLRQSDVSTFVAAQLVVGGWYGLMIVVWREDAKRSELGKLVNLSRQGSSCVHCACLERRHGSNALQTLSRSD